ncbi:hypothetical protein IF090_11575 [Acinetobacter towneri]|uniref:structural cement protein Gp24 n=1 Tax=Acinetobacter towneri TaxID=202956 RepID=UPI001CE1CACB|nr:hypothetical protein [Acinetobacter towneri]MCA4780264.1 hypothetical protein [Acinetobacter towneri]MCA4785678.1 hypothetical protein [Acinetobacter towneri]MCA4787488.1 hypothetical protein [Acinetobacter towneri]MCA4796770.1 hypothetical protein [Acinetobacter towneri]MCA4801817.1 hypothetical protein [Acinetobacter towneri]
MAAYTYRMPSGIPGDVSRKSHSTIESHNMQTPVAAFGVFAKMDATGNLAALGSSDTADAVYGLIVRSYPTTSATNDLGQAVPPKGITDVLVRGYMTVKCNAGTAKKGGAVYVRIGSEATGKPIGGIEAAADGANTIAVKARFMHDADASGNVEIAYNI